MAGYNLYRTDGVRAKINAALIPHPPVFPYLFSTVLPDNQDYTATFVLTAVDTAGNESGDSAVAPFFNNVRPPANPAGLGISK